MTVATTNKLNFGRDVQGYNSFAPNPPNLIYTVQLASAGNATLTLPMTYPYWIVAFSATPGAEFWVAYNTSAVAPSSGSFASSSSECNPGARIVPSQYTTSTGMVATTINVLNNGSGTINLSVILYASP